MQRDQRGSVGVGPVVFTKGVKLHIVVFEVGIRTKDPATLLPVVTGGNHAVELAPVSGTGLSAKISGAASVILVPATTGCRIHIEAANPVSGVEANLAPI